MEKRTRINVHFGAESYRALVNSKKIAGKETFGELIADALEIYIALQKEAVEGYTIIEVRNLDNHKRRLLKQKLALKPEQPITETQPENDITRSGD